MVRLNIFILFKKTGSKGVLKIKNISKGELIIPIIFIFFSIIYLIDVWNISKPGLNLILLGPVLIGVLALSIIIILQVFYKDSYNANKLDINFSSKALFLFFVFVYLILFKTIGYLAATVISLFLLQVYFKVEKMRALPISFVGGTLIYILFRYVLNIRL